MSKPSDKTMDLKKAVASVIKPGMSLALGLGLEGFVPHAAAHEIIRQGIDGLTLIGPISNICFDQIIAAGLVDAVAAAWVGNVSTGIGYNFRRAVEEGLPRSLTVFNHSNFSICLALEAGARGLPMAVSRSPLGSDIIKDNPHFTTFTCPHSQETLLAIKAVKPDVTIIHAQKADKQGNAMAWGATGISRQAILAADTVLVTCEELVDGGVIRSDPDRTLVPGFIVSAVCEVPWGAHPAPVQGYYDLDNDFIVNYAKRTRDPAGARAWLKEWVSEVKERPAYLRKLGKDNLTRLMTRRHALSQPVDYGW